MKESRSKMCSELVLGSYMLQQLVFKYQTFPQIFLHCCVWHVICRAASLVYLRGLRTKAARTVSTRALVISPLSGLFFSTNAVSLIKQFIPVLLTFLLAVPLQTPY
jgi:hypothetical protein